MIILNNDLKNWTDAEIISLMQILSTKRHNQKYALETISEINPIKERIEPIREKCNKIIAKSYLHKHISKSEASSLAEYGNVIKNEENLYHELKRKLANYLAKEGTIEQQEKDLLKAVQNRLNGIKESKFSMVFKKFKSRLVKDKIEKPVASEREIITVEPENIEDYYEELSSLNKTMRRDIYHKQGIPGEVLHSSLKNENSLAEGRKMSEELSERISKNARRRDKVVKIISAYEKINEDMDFINNVSLLSMTESEQSDICSKIRVKCNEIFELKSELTPGLIASLEYKYKINENLELADAPVAGPKKSIMTREEANEIMRESRRLKLQKDIPVWRGRAA